MGAKSVLWPRAESALKTAPSSDSHVAAVRTVSKRPAYGPLALTAEATSTMVGLGATGFALAGAAMAAAMRPAEATVAAIRVDVRMSGSS
jgi:hypothetical protein